MNIDTEKIQGKAFYCACSHNPNCKYCKGIGMVLIPFDVDNSKQYFKKKTDIKYVSFEERFLAMDDSILPEKLNLCITEVKRNAELEKVVELNEIIFLRTENKTVDYAIGTAIEKIMRKLELIYHPSFKIFKNKRFYIGFKIDNELISISNESFAKDEIRSLILFQAIIDFFKRKYMSNNL